jgi:hypothetical protein
MILSLDHKQKIRVYEEDFYDPQLRPMENEVRQRNKIASFLGEGGWHIQLDADEYFLDFAGFVAYLKSFHSTRRINISCPMLNLYKQLPEGMLWIKPNTFDEIEYFPIATKYPCYEHGRRNGYFNILTDFPILHQSWARSKEEMWEKLNNWGHSNDFDVMKYFNLWQNAGSKNYTTYKNFHHIGGNEWPALALQPKARELSEMMHLNKSDFPLPITNKDLSFANSLWWNRIRKVWKKLRY